MYTPHPTLRQRKVSFFEALMKMKGFACIMKKHQEKACWLICDLGCMFLWVDELDSLSMLHVLCYKIRGKIYM